MPYRLADSLITLRANINALAPIRSRISDGWIGDEKHASRSSDHNPHIKDGKTGVVTALDITHDPVHGVDGQALAEALIKDPRVKYVIWNHKIWNSSKPGWRKYTGSNPHTKHVHVSTSGSKGKYDDKTPWKISATPPTETVGIVPKPILKLGAQGGDVFELQRRLGAKVDGDFGPKTEKAVKDFQKANGLVADGIVGPYTWEALEKKKALNPLPIFTVPPAVEEEAKSKYTPAWAVNKFMELGWSRDDAVALVAHFMWESGGHAKKRINWEARGDRGNSLGGGQWNKGVGRFQQLEAFAKEREATWKSPEAQIEFANHELGTSYRGAGLKIRNAEGLVNKVRAALDYWRPGTPHLERRIEVAEKLNKEIPHEETVVADTTGTVSGSGSGGDNP